MAVFGNLNRRSAEVLGFVPRSEAGGSTACVYIKFFQKPWWSAVEMAWRRREHGQECLPTRVGACKTRLFAPDWSAPVVGSTLSPGSDRLTTGPAMRLLQRSALRHCHGHSRSTRRSTSRPHPRPSTSPQTREIGRLTSSVLPARCPTRLKHTPPAKSSGEACRVNRTVGPGGRQSAEEPPTWEAGSG